MLPVLIVSCMQTEKINLLTSGDNIRISSADTHLVSVFNWARKTSDGYLGSDNDPSGPWYEAALPGREAFCIRDVSHQCIGAEILGHSRQNLNMFRSFVRNISEKKDYCSFWEINRYDKPAPVDYISDDDFWYNLNANFDIIDACYKLYQWTGDTTYIFNRDFDRFFRLTLNEYIDRWQLQPDRIMSRPPLMNLRPSTLKYRNARGIPSYDESQEEISVSSDLIGMICNGFAKYAAILKMKGEDSLSSFYQDRSDQYLNLIDSLWWDEGKRDYHGFYKYHDGFSGGGISNSEFLLWYGIISDPERINSSLDHIKNSQVEVLSYLPLLFYRYGMNDEAYNFLMKIYTDKRRSYPEASCGAVEGIISGLMGIRPDASHNLIMTCPHLAADEKWVQADNVPVFSGLISVRHLSNTASIFANKSGRVVNWMPVFYGNFSQIRIGKDLFSASTGKDDRGTDCSFTVVKVKPGEQVAAEAEGMQH